MPPPAGAHAVPPPDGGWGWVVVCGAFISIGFSYAFPKATTVFFKDIQKIFDASYSEVAWISSIMLAVMYAGGKKKKKNYNNNNNKKKNREKWEGKMTGVNSEDKLGHAGFPFVHESVWL